MEFKDYYKILGVTKDATLSQIKKEYRKRARKYHPDVNKDASAEQKFKDLAEAYEVLKDPIKRKKFDQYGADWKDGPKRQQYQQQSQQGFNQRGGGFDFGGQGEYSDFFESFFGGQGRSRGRSTPQKRKGEDVNATISILLKEAYTGISKRISFTVSELSPEGYATNKTKSLDVKIPKGIKDGQKIRLAGQGSPGVNNGPSGDMYLKVTIQKDALFETDGTDVYLNLPIAVWEAALGAEIKVPTPTSTLKLKIPADSIQGKKLRLKGKGIPSKVPGDLYVVLNIVFPSSNDKDALKLYEEMKNLNFNPRSNF